MINAFVDSGALQKKDIGRTFDDTEALRVSTRTGANLTRVKLGITAAPRAVTNAFFCVEDRLRQLTAHLRRGLQQIQRNALSASFTERRQTGQLRHQLLNRLRIVHASYLLIPAHERKLANMAVLFGKTQKRRYDCVP